MGLCWHTILKEKWDQKPQCLIKSQFMNQKNMLNFHPTTTKKPKVTDMEDNNNNKTDTTTNNTNNKDTKPLDNKQPHQLPLKIIGVVSKKQVDGRNDVFYKSTFHPQVIMVN